MRLKLDVWNDYIARGSSPPPATIQLQRRQANAAMRRFRSVPSKRHVHYLCLTATLLPHSVRSLATLSREPDCCWIKSKRMAKALVEVDRARGGEGSFTSFEYQCCLVCRRSMIGREAADYLERRRWPREKCYWPWGPTCNAVCKPSPKRAEWASENKKTRSDRMIPRGGP
jgi:hypothetical protein